MAWDRFTQRLFITNLEKAEDCLGVMSSVEKGFVREMRERFDNRAMDAKYGHIWEPTVKQVNWLNSIAESY